MDIKHFKLVTAIAETGSLTRAAEKLFLTQSALSHQLKEVEDGLGTNVFNSVNKKLIITDAGKIFLNSSSVILSEINKLRSDIKKQLKGETGTLTLTTECYTCYHWLPQIMKRFNNDFPGIDIRLNTTQLRKPLDHLLAGKVDLAVVYRKCSEKNILFTDLFTDDVVALVPLDHPLAPKSYLVPKDFLNTHFITQYANFEETSFYEHFLKKDKIKPKKLTYIQLTEAALQMVKEGLGITAMAKWLIKPYIDQSKMKVIRLGPHGLKRKWYIATLRKHEQPRFMVSFIEQLKTGIPLS